MKSEKNCLINIGKKGRFSTVPEMFLGCSKNILKRMFQGVKGNLWVFQDIFKEVVPSLLKWETNLGFGFVSRYSLFLSQERSKIVLRLGGYGHIDIESA